MNTTSAAQHTKGPNSLELRKWLTGQSAPQLKSLCIRQSIPPAKKEDMIESLIASGYQPAWMKRKATPTQWRVVPHGLAELWQICDGIEVIAREMTKEHAELFAEAGTVASESGCTPRQLLAQRDELLKLAEQIRWLAYAGEAEREQDGVPYEIGPGDWIRLVKAARAAIRSAKPE